MRGDLYQGRILKMNQLKLSSRIQLNLKCMLNQLSKLLEELSMMKCILAVFAKMKYWDKNSSSCQAVNTTSAMIVYTIWWFKK